MGKPVQVMFVLAGIASATRCQILSPRPAPLCTLEFPVFLTLDNQLLLQVVDMLYQVRVSTAQINRLRARQVSAILLQQSVRSQGQLHNHVGLLLQLFLESGVVGVCQR